MGLYPILDERGFGFDPDDPASMIRSEGVLAPLGERMEPYRRDYDTAEQRYLQAQQRVVNPGKQPRWRSILGGIAETIGAPGSPLAQAGNRLTGRYSAMRDLDAAEAGLRVAGERFNRERMYQVAQEQAELRKAQLNETQARHAATIRQQQNELEEKKRQNTRKEYGDRVDDLRKRDMVETSPTERITLAPLPTEAPPQPLQMGPQEGSAPGVGPIPLPKVPGYLQGPVTIDTPTFGQVDVEGYNFGGNDKAEKRSFRPKTTEEQQEDYYTKNPNKRVNPAEKANLLGTVAKLPLSDQHKAAVASFVESSFDGDPAGIRKFVSDVMSGQIKQDDAMERVAFALANRPGPRGQYFTVETEDNQTAYFNPTTGQTVAPPDGLRKPLPESRRKSVDEIKNIIEELKFVDGLAKKNPKAGSFMGPLEGRFKTAKTAVIGDDPDVMEVIRVTKDLLDRVGRNRSGAQINQSEWDRLSQIVPTVNQPPETFRSNLQGFVRSLSNIVARAENRPIPFPADGQDQAPKVGAAQRPSGGGSGDAMTEQQFRDGWTKRHSASVPPEQLKSKLDAAVQRARRDGVIR